MDPDHHQALAAWPWALAAAATAVMVTTDYRPEDVLRAAAALGRLGSGPRELYRLLVSRLDAAHKELPEATRWCTRARFTGTRWRRRRAARGQESWLASPANRLATRTSRSRGGRVGSTGTRTSGAVAPGRQPCGIS